MTGADLPSHDAEADRGPPLQGVRTLAFLACFCNISAAVLEAEDKEQAMLSVPTFLRGQARVVQLTKFAPEKVEGMHRK